MRENEDLFGDKKMRFVVMNLWGFGGPTMKEGCELVEADTPEEAFAAATGAKAHSDATREMTPNRAWEFSNLDPKKRVAKDDPQIFVVVVRTLDGKQTDKKIIIDRRQGNKIAFLDEKGQSLICSDVCFTLEEAVRAGEQVQVIAGKDGVVEASLTLA